MTVEVYKITFNSNHNKVAMKTTIWIHEDVLDHFKNEIKSYAKRKGLVQYTEQQIMADQYLQQYRILLDKYDTVGLSDQHILCLKQEYEEILRKNDILEKFEFFVVPKHIDALFNVNKIDMSSALQLLKTLKGANGIIIPGCSDWIGHHERQVSRNIRMEIK
jgi:hypothetical protein